MGCARDSGTQVADLAEDELARLRVARDPAVDAIAGGPDRVADQQQRSLGAQRRDPEAVRIHLTLRRERRRRLQEPELGLDVATAGMEREQTTHATGNSTSSCPWVAREGRRRAAGAGEGRSRAPAHRGP